MIPSEIALSQKTDGFQSRQVPCGMKPLVSKKPPRNVDSIDQTPHGRVKRIRVGPPPREGRGWKYRRPRFRDMGGSKDFRVGVSNGRFSATSARTEDCRIGCDPVPCFEKPSSLSPIAIKPAKTRGRQGIVSGR